MYHHLLQAFFCCQRMFFRLGKFLGLFHLARRLTRSYLRILCYHGFSLNDEGRFRPGTFMEFDTFRKRLDYLSNKGFPVLGLEESLDLLDRQRLPSCATVITFDDGWYSTYKCVREILGEYSFPATIYVMSYYVAREYPVFNMVVRYMFWKTELQQLDLGQLGINMSGTISFRNRKEKQRILQEIIKYAEMHLEQNQQCTLAKEVGKRLGVDFHAIAQSRCLSHMTSEEIQEMAAAGINIQLHTHRHHFPVDEVIVRQEIADNRAVLEPLVGRPLLHFCYPSGRWSDKHWPWLAEAGIRSAVTIIRGLNRAETPRLALRRISDGEHISQIEFEAEMSGFAEMVRRSGFPKLFRIITLPLRWTLKRCFGS